ncbi:MAG: HAMP domain-containing histidine kinase [Chloroflexi bacterium]|nr:HAMP domain-containing histidine kinase [Chloroflexota bacterium]
MNPSGSQPLQELDLAAFVSREAHDLKSPFNRILGFLKLVINGLDGPLTDLQRDDLTTAYHNAIHALALMSNLVDMARFSRGDKLPSFTRENILEIWAQACQTWRKGNPGREVKLFDPGSPSPTSLPMDGTLMQKAFLHWISYVSGFVKDPCEVRLEIAETAVDTRLTIRGRGEKSAPAACDQAMDDYLGRAILSLHHGIVESTDETDQGAQVILRLPKGTTWAT